MTKRYRMTALLMVMTMLVAACGGSASDDAEESTATTEAGTTTETTTESATETTSAEGDSEAAEEGVEITVWVNSAESEALQALYDKYSEATGNTVERVSFPSDGYETALLQRWAAGDRPDVLQWHGNFNWVAAVNPRDNLMPLTDEEFVGRTLGGILDTNASIDGVVYGAILNAPTAFGLFYNKAVFEDLGLTPPTTAAEILSTCEAIQAAGGDIAPLLESAGSQWPPLVQHGAFMADAMEAGWLDRINSRDAKVNDADSAWLRANEFFVELQDTGCYNDDLLTSQWEDSATRLLAGEVAMVSMHTGLVQQAVDAVGIEEVNATIGWTPWSETRPIVTVESSPLGTYYVPMTGDGVTEAAALEFIRFVTGPAYEEYVAEAGLPPVLDGVATPDGIAQPLLDVQVAIGEYGSSIPVWSLLPGITSLVTYPGQLLTAELTPQSAADLLQVEAEQGAEQAGLPAWP
ncbi:MAG: ABC transporter substrate-binding protein [Acidimicrobiia bacterium]